MEMQIGRGRLGIEKIRQDIDESQIRVGKALLEMDKAREDMALDIDRLSTQRWAVGATMLGAFPATLAAGAALVHFFIK